MDRGEVAFTRMEKVIFGDDAAAAAKAQVVTYTVSGVI